MNYLPKLMGKYLNKNIYTHLYRHSSARFMIDKGLNIQDVSRILGHSSITTTMLYVNPSDTAIKNKYKEKMI
jgi:site-specific recombinase XerD